MEQQYSSEKITVLKGLEAVRKRPAMYIGDVGKKGLHHLIWEVVDNSIDEAMAGHCDTILVEVEEDGSITVEDNMSQSRCSPRKNIYFDKETSMIHNI